MAAPSSCLESSTVKASQIWRESQWSLNNGPKQGPGGEGGPWTTPPPASPKASDMESIVFLVDPCKKMYLVKRLLVMEVTHTTIPGNEKSEVSFG